MKTFFRMLFLAGVLLAFLCAGGCRNAPIDPEPQTPEAPKPPQSSVSKFLYQSDETGVTILGYSGIESTIAVPARIDGKPVRAIAENAFRDFTFLERVYLPDSVEVIDYAFVGCRDLVSVSLGRGIVSLNGAFRGCTALTSVQGAPDVVSLDEAFYGCSSLTEATIPASAVSARSAFAGCSSLKTAVLAEGIAVLDHTFADCISLRSVAIPNSVTELLSAFAGCTSLSEVTGGRGAAVLDGTFQNCVSLTSFALSDSLTALSGAFLGCISLNTLDNIPRSLSRYDPSFTGCRSLRTLLIPEITNEASRAAYDPRKDVEGCTDLRTITIVSPFTVRDEFCRIFSGCQSLEEVTIDDGTAADLLRVDYYITDAVFKEKNKTVSDALSKCVKASVVRITQSYAIVDGVPYTHIYGGDIDTPDPAALIAKTEIIPFKPFIKTSYWCGYPDGGSRKTDSSAICRTWSFFLRTTGRNDGSLPETLFVNGQFCSVGGE